MKQDLYRHTRSPKLFSSTGLTFWKSSFKRNQISLLRTKCKCCACDIGRTFALSLLSEVWMPFPCMCFSPIATLFWSFMLCWVSWILPPHDLPTHRQHLTSTDFTSFSPFKRNGESGKNCRIGLMLETKLCAYYFFLDWSFSLVWNGRGHQHRLDCA